MSEFNCARSEWWNSGDYVGVVFACLRTRILENRIKDKIGSLDVRARRRSDFDWPRWGKMLVRVCVGQRWAVACMHLWRVGFLGFTSKLGVAVRWLSCYSSPVVVMAACVERGEFDRTAVVGAVRRSRPIVILLLHGACV